MGDLAAEEGLGRGLGVLGFGWAVHAGGDVAGQGALGLALAGALGVGLLEGLGLLARQEREDLEEADGVGIGGVEPELVEGVGRRAVGGEPDGAGLGLAELAAVGLRDQGGGEAVDIGVRRRKLCRAW